ncbi:MAG: VWA domain-containing protein [Calditrichaeota bacterium]|nr:MAG: VWA domain-containing protein [Calditrichota bacterium]
MSYKNLFFILVVFSLFFFSSEFSLGVEQKEGVKTETKKKLKRTRKKVDTAKIPQKEKQKTQVQTQIAKPNVTQQNATKTLQTPKTVKNLSSNGKLISSNWIPRNGVQIRKSRLFYDLRWSSESKSSAEITFSWEKGDFIFLDGKSYSLKDFEDEIKLSSIKFQAEIFSEGIYSGKTGEVSLSGNFEEGKNFTEKVSFYSDIFRGRTQTEIQRFFENGFRLYNLIILEAEFQNCCENQTSKLLKSKISLANQLFKKKDFGKAERVYNEVLKIDSENKKAKNKLAEIQEMKAEKRRKSLAQRKLSLEKMAVGGAVSLDETETSSAVEGDLKSSSDFGKFEEIPPPKKQKTFGGLKAGFVDDNKQFNHYLNFLEKFEKKVKHDWLEVGEKITFKAQDSNGNSLPNALVEIYSDDKFLRKGKTYSDGTFLFFPNEYSQKDNLTAKVYYNQNTVETQFEVNGKREVEIILANEIKNSPQEIPLDVLFIFDTTGSMGEEIDRLKSTIELIKINLESLKPKPQVRFGMVLYKDRGDSYVTKVIPLTTDLKSFQSELNKVRASGGGDTREDLNSALEDAMTKIEWNENGIKTSFVITDAPPQIDYKNQTYNYSQAVRDAQEKGVKIFTIGTGGLDIQGEFVLRQISQYTYSKYVFLHYGEKGESDGGKVGSVSHHTGTNYQTDKLEAILIQILKEEMLHFLDKPIEEDYFEAEKIAFEDNTETLKKLFDLAISQLIDFASIKIEKETPASVMTISPMEKVSLAESEYFTANLMLSFKNNSTFQVIERDDLQKILQELHFQHTDLADEEKAAEIGKLIGAKILITGELYSKNKNYELFLKLLNVETGEVLSVTKTVIDRNLGLSS